MKRTDNIAAGVTPTIMMQSSEITPDMRDRARRTVAANATSIDDARELLSMLGILDPGGAEQRPVRLCKGTCGRPVRSQREDADSHPGTVVVHVKGMCQTCYLRRREDAEAALALGERPSHCLDCGEPMRPSGSRPEDFPGTRSHNGRGYCSTCYDRHPEGRGTKPLPIVVPEVCHGGCGNRLRPQGEPVSEWPGTISHFRRGLCRTCHRRDSERAQS